VDSAGRRRRPEKSFEAGSMVIHKGAAAVRYNYILTMDYKENS